MGTVQLRYDGHWQGAMRLSTAMAWPYTTPQGEAPARRVIAWLYNAPTQQWHSGFSLDTTLRCAAQQWYGHRRIKSVQGGVKFRPAKAQRGCAATCKGQMMGCEYCYPDNDGGAWCSYKFGRRCLQDEGKGCRMWRNEKPKIDSPFWTAWFFEEWNYWRRVVLTYGQG